MHKNIVLLILILSQTTFACEAELTLHSLTQVIFAAVDQGFVPAEKIQQWLSRKGQGNPMTGLALKGKGLSYRQGIETLLGGVSPQVLSQIQAQLEKRGQQNKQKEKAREIVRSIVSPTEITGWTGGNELAWSPPEAGPPMVALVNSQHKVEVRRPFDSSAPIHRFESRFDFEMGSLTWSKDESGKLKLWILDQWSENIFVGDLSSPELQPVPISKLPKGEIIAGWDNVSGMSPLLITHREDLESMSEYSKAYSLSPTPRTVFENDGEPPESNCWLLDKENQLLVLNKGSSGVQISYALTSETSVAKAARKFPQTKSGKALKLFQTKSGRVLAIAQTYDGDILIRAPFEKDFRQIKFAATDRRWGTPEFLEYDERIIMAVSYMYDGDNGEEKFGIAAYEPFVSKKPIWKLENLDDGALESKMWIGERKSLFLGASVGDNKLLIAEPLANSTFPLFTIQGEVKSWIEYQGQMFFTTKNSENQKHVLYRVMK